MEEKFKVRCSALSSIVGAPKTKAAQEAGELSQTAKSAVRDMALFDIFGFSTFESSKYTEKGNLLEEQAIKASSAIRGRMYSKNTERKENDWISGECDIYDPRRSLIIDTKCVWDIKNMPFFGNEAEEKAISDGYDWQMQGYMWLWGCERAEVDFWLFPTPDNLLNVWDNKEKYQDLVEQIPQGLRVKTVAFMRNEMAIERIKERVERCQEYYYQLRSQYEPK